MDTLSKEEINAVATALYEKAKAEEFKKFSRDIHLEKKFLITGSNVVIKQFYPKLKAGPSIDIRYLILTMLANEINRKNIAGSIAELGVFRGVFAQRMRALFPDRTFYLFDTFDGFDEKQKSDDFLNFGAKFDNFKDTSIEIALKTIGDTKNCVVKKGLFPETAKDVDDVFAFVSLDADLYEPIRDGLHFFYDKMASGGYILIHDFINAAYPGCEKAVREFCTEKKLAYAPMPDNVCSALICIP